MRPVTCDLTRLAAKFHLWMLTGSDLTLRSHEEERVQSLHGWLGHRSDQMPRWRVRSCCHESGLKLTREGLNLTVGIVRVRLNGGDTWMAMVDRTLRHASDHT